MRNMFPGYCYKCGQYVPTGFGFFERVNFRQYGRKWRVQCVGCCDGRKVRQEDCEVRNAIKNRDKWIAAKEG